jgi:hypothetical protein
VANSAYLTKVVEPFIVEWVSQRIGVELKPKRLPVGPRTDGTVVHFDFDGVSEDGRTGLLVSTSHTIKTGGVRKLHVDASILLRTDFDRRFMAFVSDDVHRNFVNRCDGLLELSKIKMLICDVLPSDMHAAMAEFQARAKSEVGDKGKKWKLGGQRR